MRPAFQSDGMTLYHADSLALMEHLEAAIPTGCST